MHLALKESSLELFIAEKIFVLYPFYNGTFRLSKVIYVSKEDLLSTKKKITQTEIIGSTYIFWCFVTPQYEKPFFIFGQLTYHNFRIYFEQKKAKFSHFAHVAYKKNWFDQEDVRQNTICYMES